MNLDKAKVLIKKFEGCSLVTYKDLNDIDTIGYGHTGKDVIPKMTITQEQADDLMEHDMFRTLAMLYHVVPSIDMKSENKVNALVSFVFNEGIGKFQTSTMLRKIKSGDTQEDIAREFDRWVFCKGKAVEGLILRRKAEKDLFLTA